MQISIFLLDGKQNSIVQKSYTASSYPSPNLPNQHYSLQAPAFVKYLPPS